MYIAHNHNTQTTLVSRIPLFLLNAASAVIISEGVRVVGAAVVAGAAVDALSDFDETLSDRSKPSHIASVVRSKVSANSLSGIV
jgi:hypothetical protein